MNLLWSFFPRLLSILAIAGLLAAPVATPSLAATMAVEPMAEVSGMVSMPEGMPCSPEQKQSVPDCLKSCPLATLCVAKIFPSAPKAPRLTLRLSESDVVAPANDVGRDSLAEPPPPRPPRT